MLGYAAATLTTASFVPQAWRTFRTKDVSGISLRMYSVFTLGVAVWLAYGIVGAVMYLVAGADVFASLAFAVRHLVDPFGVAVLGISALLGLGAVALAARGPSSTV